MRKLAEAYWHLPPCKIPDVVYFNGSRLGPASPIDYTANHRFKNNNNHHNSKTTPL